MKKRRIYATMDGMRSVAALLVLVGHSVSAMGGGWFGHAGLAVDMFFALSGFVIERAYGERLRNGWSFRRFMLTRYIRLWPLFALGLLGGILSVLAGVLIGYPLKNWTAGTLVLSSLVSLVMLPTPFAAGHDSFIVPLNYVGWSLVDELFANAMFVFFYRRLTLGVLLAACLIGGILVLTYCDRGGGLSSGGPAWNNAGWGLARALFAFPLGVLLARAQEGCRVTSWAAVLPIILAVLLSTEVSWLWYDATCDLIGFPLLLLGAAHLEPGPRLSRLFRAGGLASYAVYILQSPIILAQIMVSRFLHLSPNLLLLFSVVVLSVYVVACVGIDRWYDLPIRHKLTTLLLHRKDVSVSTEPAQTAP